MTSTLATHSTSFLVRQEYLDQFRLFQDQESGTSSDDEVVAPPYAKAALKDATIISRNRYSDILPYQANIFSYANPDLYFNASRVLQGRAISCQGPLDNEHAHFWRMAWESRTTAIVMLTDLVEKDATKCSWYLPEETGATLPEKFELPQGEEIAVTQMEGLPKPTVNSMTSTIELVERQLELEYKGEKRSVTHYHLKGWLDCKTAPEVILARLVSLVWDRHFSKGQHIISHCSAGVGRSGTFLTILEIVSQLKNGTELTPDLVLSNVRQLRSFDDGRRAMVQNINQYGLIFKTLAVLDANCAKLFCQPNKPSEHS